MMLKDVFSFDNVSSCTSEVFDSLNGIDDLSPSMKKSNEFLQLIERLSVTNFSDDENLVKAREMINDAELTVPQWRKVTSVLINELIMNKNRSNASEPNEESLQKKDGFTLSIKNDIKSKKSSKLKVQHKPIVPHELDLCMEDDYEKEINQNGGGLWGKGEEQLVPFEIGMKILNGSINTKDQIIGEETKKKIKKIEDDACRMAYKRMNESPDYQRLFREKEHWKYLAKTRLIELENEIDFRYQLVFGDDKKRFL